jgi:hypothetical protein
VKLDSVQLALKVADDEGEGDSLFPSTLAGRGRLESPGGIGPELRAGKARRVSLAGLSATDDCTTFEYILKKRHLALFFAAQSAMVDQNLLLSRLLVQEHTSV